MSKRITGTVGELRGNYGNVNLIMQAYDFLGRRRKRNRQVAFAKNFPKKKVAK